MAGLAYTSTPDAAAPRSGAGSIKAKGLVTDPGLIAELELKSAAQPKLVSDPELIKALDTKSSANGPKDDVNPFAKFVPGARPAAEENPFAKFANTAPDVKPHEPTQSDWGTYVKGLVRSAAKGATFNWSDEIEALARGAFSGDREMALARIRDEMDAFAKANPKTALAAEIAGGFAVPGLGTVKAVGAVARNANLAGRMAVGAGIGAAESAVAGAGDAEGGAAAASQSAKTALLPGAVIGAAIPAAGAALKPVGRAVAALVPDSAPVIGGAARAVKERVAGEQINDALRKDAELGGRSAEQQLREVRDALVVDRHSTRGSGTASILTAAENPATGRVGEHIQQLAKDTGQRSNEAQAALRSYARDVDAALPRNEYERFYARGAVPQGSQFEQAINHLVATDPAIRHAEALARRNFSVGSSVQPPPAGQYNAELLHRMDQELRAASERASRDMRNGSRGQQIGQARERLAQQIEGAFPDIGSQSSLRTIQTRTAVGKSQGRVAENVATEGGTRDRSLGVINDALSAAMGAAAGHQLGPMRATARAISRVVRGDLDRGVTLARLLTQQTGKLSRPGGMAQSIEMIRILNALEAMPANQRTRYLDAAIAASSQQIGANVAQ